MRCRSATSPPRPLPKWKSAPTTTSRACAAADQHLAHEVFRRLAAAGLVEVQHEREVEVAGGVEQLELLLGRGEELRRRLRPHHLGGMAVEGDAHRGEVARVGQLADEAQHRVVPEVHAVVHTDGDDRAARVPLGPPSAADSSSRSSTMRTQAFPAHAPTTTTAGRSAAPLLP